MRYRAHLSVIVTAMSSALALAVNGGALAQTQLTGSFAAGTGPELSSSLSGSPIYTITDNGNNTFPTIWVGPSVNLNSYASLYPNGRDVRQLTNLTPINGLFSAVNGILVNRHQTPGYLYFTAAFSSPGVYSFRVNGSVNDDITGAVYASQGGGSLTMTLTQFRI